MRANAYFEEPIISLLDVGCNVGAWLQDCARRYPSARLAGVDINQTALDRARLNVPTAELLHAGAEELPFPDMSFQTVTCIEVIEHLPPDLRPAAFREMRRVLKPGGRLVLTVPHAGWFDWLDSNNVRFRLPNLYRRVVGRGGRDSNYAAAGRQVEWHHHFTVAELERLAGDGWQRVAVRRGGLFLCPLMEWLSWPFYRLGIPHHPVRRMFERMAGWDCQLDFGNASYRVLVALERAGDPVVAAAECLAVDGYDLPGRDSEGGE
jgi:SAM-dependent methyltransferase